MGAWIVGDHEVEGLPSGLEQLDQGKLRLPVELAQIDGLE